MPKNNITIAVAVLAFLASAPVATGAELPADALQRLTELRERGFCPPAPTDDSAREILFQGRPALEIKAREREGAAAGKLREFAILDRSAGRIVTFICLAHASARQAGEPIISLAEISTRADQLARAVAPGVVLDLESIERYRTSGQESIYYEARYAPAQAEYPWFEPPVRLLLNATTGALFRLDIDPQGLGPVAVSRSLVSRRLAERIAAVVLRSRDLTPAFGAGAVLEKVAAAELFVVRPNGWLGINPDPAVDRDAVAWVVPVRISGGDAPGTHSLFVDAASGRVLGGREGPREGSPRR